MKTNKIALFMVIAFALVMAFSFTSTIAYAGSVQGQTQTFTTQGVTSSTTGTTSSTNGAMDKIQITTNPETGIPDVALPNVQIDQAEKFVERKGFEVVGLLQKFIQPFAIAVFIGSAMISLVGSLGNSTLVGKGIVGMVIAVLMYAIVLSAPELLDFANAWLKS